MKIISFFAYFMLIGHFTNSIYGQTEQKWQIKPIQQDTLKNFTGRTGLDIKRDVPTSNDTIIFVLNNIIIRDSCVLARFRRDLDVKNVKSVRVVKKASKLKKYGLMHPTIFIRTKRGVLLDILDGKK